MSIQADSMRVANHRRHTLGEGPVWDRERGCLRWVDILDGRLLTGTLTDGGEIQIEDSVLVGEFPSAIAPTTSGGLLIAIRNRIVVEDQVGVRDVAVLFPIDERRRLNDGKPDPNGGFVVGTIALSAESSPQALYRVDPDGHVTIVDEDLGLSNGLAWSPDRQTFYNIDTERGVLFRRSYDPEAGSFGKRDAMIQFDEGSPDGMTVDDQGNLWVAVWGTGTVQRFDPAGRQSLTIEVPAPYVTSVVFAGEHLDTLVITTATVGMSNSELSEFPDAGKLFTVSDVAHGIEQSVARI